MHRDRTVRDHESHHRIGRIVADIESRADVLREDSASPYTEWVAGIVRDIEVRVSAERNRAVTNAVAARYPKHTLRTQDNSCAIERDDRPLAASRHVRMFGEMRGTGRGNAARVKSPHTQRNKFNSEQQITA